MGKKIIFCNCQGKIIEDSKKDKIESTLANSGVQYTKLTDLCSLCATQKEEAQKLFNIEDETLVIACYPRAVSRLLDYACVEWKPEQLFVVNMRETSMQEIKPQISSFPVGDASHIVSQEIEGDGDWPSWYPVIDYSRCSSCGQCADFCLFGVYSKSDGKVTVVNPKGCKNNCPACARICPQTAIIFAKYELGGAIAGSDSIDEMAEQQRQLQDVDTILGSDIYKALELRKMKRKSIISNDAMSKAMEERENALKMAKK